MLLISDPRFIGPSKKLRLSFIISLLFLCLTSLSQPGKDGSYTVSAGSQVLNQYCPVSSNIAYGSNTLALVISTMALCPGDLIMVYQAQGATISTVNATSYGDISAYNSAGLYEFKYVQSVNGNTITTQTAFTNSYLTVGNVQVIKVPQYASLTINPGASLSAATWTDITVSSVVLPLRRTCCNSCRQYN